jgi:hypothetical protein
VTRLATPNQAQQQTGGGHGPGFDKPEIAAAVEAFFDRHLKAKAGGK